MATQIETAASAVAADCFPSEALLRVPPEAALPPSPSSTADSFDNPLNEKITSQSMDADGLPVIDRETIIDALWKSNEDHAMSMMELTKMFDLGKKKNGPGRRFKFRQNVADITYIRNDRVKGFTLVLKRSYYPVSS